MHQAKVDNREEANRDEMQQNESRHVELGERMALTGGRQLLRGYEGPAARSATDQGSGGRIVQVGSGFAGGAGNAHAGLLFGGGSPPVKGGRVSHHRPSPVYRVIPAVACGR